MATPSSGRIKDGMGRLSSREWVVVRVRRRGITKPRRVTSGRGECNKSVTRKRERTPCRPAGAFLAYTARGKRTPGPYRHQGDLLSPVRLRHRAGDRPGWRPAAHSRGDRAADGQAEAPGAGVLRVPAGARSEERRVGK